MKKWKFVVHLHGHAGFGATNQMIDRAKEIPKDEFNDKVDWWGKDEGKTWDEVDDWRDISDVVWDEVEFEATEECVKAVAKGISILLDAANDMGDVDLVGGVWHEIVEVK